MSEKRLIRSWDVKFECGCVIRNEYNFDAYDAWIDAWRERDPVNCQTHGETYVEHVRGMSG